MKNVYIYVIQYILKDMQLKQKLLHCIFLFIMYIITYNNNNTKDGGGKWKHTVAKFLTTWNNSILALIILGKVTDATAIK